MKQLSEYYTTTFAPLNPLQIKLGLDSVAQMDAQLGYPSRKFSTIHVGGTNGKGSVSTKIAHALMHSGKKTALYTSPHLVTVYERIWVQGSFIKEDVFDNYLMQVVDVAKKIGLQPTFFELLTLIAFLHFAQEKVEIAVIEVGMGGRLDATNIITPLLSIITSIGLDHKEHLGNTIEEIAFEKAGIIKEKVPVILGKRAVPFSLFQKIADERGSLLYRAEEGVDFEESNQKTAALALEKLPFTIPQSAKKRGLEVMPLCRFEIIRKDPLVILDVAHNIEGLEALFQKLHLHYPSMPLVIVAAFSSVDKAPLMASLLKEKSHALFLTKPLHERIVDPPNVIGAYREESVAKALALAYERAQKERALLLICGTFFIMEEVFTFFDIKQWRGLLYDLAK